MGKHRKPSKPDAQTAPASHEKRIDNLQQKPKPANNGVSKTKSGLSFSPRPDWHAAALPDLDLPSQLHTLPPELLQTTHEYADGLLKNETALYGTAYLQKSSDHKFMNNVMTSGTWSDKVSALTLVVQESPLHTSKQFETLLGLASKRSRDNALTALAAIKDMLAQGHMLPQSRKLRYFGKQPALLAAFNGTHTWNATQPLPKGLTKQHLLYWSYEDWLKRSYFQVLKLLESWLGDTVENAQTRSLDFVFELLRERPEQEENLLRLLVNKLGDTNRKIASRASHRILQLETAHPSMKSIIVNAIDSELLLKPGQSSHARYYAAITLNQTALTAGDPETANKLLDIYFGVFVVLLNRSKRQNKLSESAKKPDGKRKKTLQLDHDDSANPEKQLEEKLIAQILAGIQRAFPYSSQDNNKTLETHIGTLFSITHSSNFGTSLRALALLCTITSTHTAVTGNSNLRDRFMRSLYESLLDPRLISATGKHTMYLNLLYRSLKDESSMARVKAFTKRLLQICTLQEPPFMVSVFYLVNELSKLFPSLRTMFDHREASSDASDDEEFYCDVPDDDDADGHDDSKDGPLPGRSVHERVRPHYDPRKRDPLHANADLACLWDVNPYVRHYHPSVSLFTRTMVPHSNDRTRTLPPRPDPANHTLAHFLDRFAYRNPKSVQDSSTGEPKALRGHSVMQPALASADTTDHYLGSRTDYGDLPVSSEQFWQKKVDEIAPQDVFFHRYFSTVGPSRKAAKGRKHAEPHAGTGKDGDEFDEEIGANEDEIWKALVGSRPEVEGSSGEEDDGDDSEEVDADFEKAMLSDQDEEGEDGGVELNLESDEEPGDGDGELRAEDGVNPLEEDEMFENGDSMEQDGAVEMFGPGLDEDSEGSREGDMGSQRKRKKRKLSRLPMFARADDYTKMINDGDADRDSA
ncbi:MAG: hypothetical protein Q9159_006475 [Coniocarpon cinnabarinum]